MKLWGPFFFYFLKLRFLKYIPVKYQHKILSRELSKLRSEIRILPFKCVIFAANSKKQGQNSDLSNFCLIY